MEISSFVLFGLGLLILFGCIAFFRFFFQANKALEEESIQIDNPYYSTEEGAIVYSGYYPVGADSSSFTALDSKHPFGKDNQRVFFRDKPVQGAISASFRIIRQVGSLYYSADERSVFINTHPIAGADISSFEVFANSQFARDKQFVYYQGKRVKDAHSLTFQSLEGDYGRDKNHFFLRRTPVDISTIPKSVLSTTEVLSIG